MAGLKSLIRLHEWTVDERRRDLARHIKLLNDLDQAIIDLKKELQKEMALAASNPSGVGMTFGHYYTMVRRRREQIERSITQKEAEIRDARDILGRAYIELKKYEIAQDVRKKREEEEARRAEQKELDEIGLQLYRRKKSGR
ncbi:MAG: flagellar FliJ family protein [Rhodospirillaceae bacterium]